MNKKRLILFIIISILALPTFGQTKKSVKKVVRYKKQMTIDLTGTVIKGQAKSPDIFYIFRRKRTTGGNILSIPLRLNHHIPATISKTKEFVE